MFCVLLIGFSLGFSLGFSWDSALDSYFLDFIDLLPEEVET